MHHILSKSQQRAVAHFLATGETDPNSRDWPGQNFLEIAVHSTRILREALIASVLARVPPQTQAATPALGDLVALTRDKVAPMVRGLFPQAERPAVMDALATSVRFLTPQNIESTLRTTTYLHSCWQIACIYLLERGAEPLSAEAPSLVGMSEETTCYLSLAYLTSQQREPFSDYLVHEAAHVFHNCKRSMIGLKETRSREFLLNIDFRQRETFAYSCEAYSRILTMASTPQRRREALAEYAHGPLPGDSRLDHAQHLSILSTAVNARNGWKHILAACTPR